MPVSKVMKVSGQIFTITAVGSPPDCAMSPVMWFGNWSYRAASSRPAPRKPIIAAPHVE
jgi:hypothetical protein